MDVGGGGRDVLRSHSRVTPGPQNGKIHKSQCRRLEERNPQGGEGSFAAIHPHIT